MLQAAVLHVAHFEISRAEPLPRGSRGGVSEGRAAWTVHGRAAGAGQASFSRCARGIEARAVALCDCRVRALLVPSLLAAAIFSLQVHRPHSVCTDREGVCHELAAAAMAAGTV